MHVLAEIDAARLEMVVELAEGDDLLVHGMAAVVDQDVDARHLPAHLGEELRVLLVPDQDGRGRVLELPAARIYVDADDLRAGSEVFVPHLQRAAVGDPDLDDHRAFPAKPLEMAVIDLEVVVPLVD